MATWLLIASCGLALALPLVWRVALGRFDPFEPIVLFALAYGAMFVARPTAVLVNDETRFWGIDVLPTLPKALLLALVGAVAFVTGYELRLGRASAARLPTPRPTDPRIALISALVLAGLGLVMTAVFYRATNGIEALRILFSGRSPELGELFRTTSTYVWNASLLLAPAALIVVGLALGARSVRLAVVALAVLGLALARVAPMGGRIVMLPLVGGVLVLFYVMRGRRPRMRALGLLALVALVVSFFTLYVRDPTDDLTFRTAIEELRARPQAVLDPVTRGADAEMVLALSVALTVVPDELPHRWGGATIGNLLTRPVPREIWSGKPLPPESVIVSTVWPHLYPGLQPAFSPLLPLYWDFGLVGVVLGMAIFGIAARSLYEWFSLHRRSFAAQLIFASSLWFMVIGARNDPVDTIVLGAFLVGPVVATTVLASEGFLRRPAARAELDDRGRGAYDPEERSEAS